jgi:hypothetical protein
MNNIFFKSPKAEVERQPQQAEGLLLAYSSPAGIMITEIVLSKQSFIPSNASSKTAGDAVVVRSNDFLGGTLDFQEAFVKPHINVVLCK